MHSANAAVAGMFGIHRGRVPSVPRVSKSVIDSLLTVALVALLLLSGAAFAGPAAAAQMPIPALTARVTDLTGTLDAAQQATLETKLEYFETSNGGQIAILIVPTTGDETIEQYSIRAVDAWKLGHKGVDDGLLLLVAKNDRKVRIEVGKGFEGLIPDAIANRIIDGFMTPKFRAGDYAAGLNEGIDRIIGVVNGEALPQVSTNEVSAVSDTPAVGTPIPEMTAHIVDQTSLLTYAQVRALDAKLAAFEKSKGQPIAILLVASTGDESLEDFSNRVFDAWKLSKSAVLILFTQNADNVRITPGRGLSSVLTHPIMRRILDEDMSWPNVPLGDVAEELNAGVDRIIKVENGEAMPPPKPESSFEWPSFWESLSPPPLGAWVGTLVGLIFVFVVSVAVFEDASAFRRGVVTAVLVAVVLLIAGAGIGFVLALAAIAFYFAMTINTGAVYVGGWGSFLKDFDKDDRHESHVSGWSILGTIAGGLISSSVSGGGGGGSSFSGGGGGFSGGGASGSW